MDFFLKKMNINKLVFVECIQIIKNEHSDERINVVIVDDDDNDVDVIYSAASIYFFFVSLANIWLEKFHNFVIFRYYSYSTINKN